MDPWEYDLKEKVDDIVSLIIPRKNPNYMGKEVIETKYNTYLQKTNDVTPLTKDKYISIYDPSMMFKTRRE